jgi:hypothetical protein
MNKRIKELAEQAKFAMDVSNDPNSPPSWWAAGHNDTFEKFAELIVRECLMKVTGAKIRNESYDELIARINEDFGVEL